MTLAYDLSETYAPEHIADRGEAELNTALIRRFLGIGADEPVEVTAFRGKRIHVGDTSVATPARLMPAPGTWKRKGWSTPERPHRMTSFCCRPHVRRIRLDEIA